MLITKLVLDISSIQLKEIPEKLGNLRSLVVLDASTNQLTVEKFPKQLANCQLLKKIYLSTNGL